MNNCTLYKIYILHLILINIIVPKTCAITRRKQTYFVYFFGTSEWPITYKYTFYGFVQFEQRFTIHNDRASFWYNLHVLKTIFERFVCFILHFVFIQFNLIGHLAWHSLFWMKYKAIKSLWIWIKQSNRWLPVFHFIIKGCA